MKFGQSSDTLVSFVQEVEVVSEAVTERAFLTSAFRETEEDVVVGEEEEGGKVVDCFVGRDSEVEAAVLLGDAALLCCVVSCFPVDPVSFCEGFCLTIFSSSICVSAVP